VPDVPVATASAFRVWDALTVNGTEYAEDAVVGVEPSVV
jgi:hypothetical protein